MFQKVRNKKLEVEREFEELITKLDISQPLDTLNTQNFLSKAMIYLFLIIFEKIYFKKGEKEMVKTIEHTYSVFEEIIKQAQKEAQNEEIPVEAQFYLKALEDIIRIIQEIKRSGYG